MTLPPPVQQACERPTNGRLYITEKESVALLHDGFFIAGEFGQGWFALTWDEGQPMPDSWRQVLLMRGILNENCEGSGI